MNWFKKLFSRKIPDGKRRVVQIGQHTFIDPSKVHAAYLKANDKGDNFDLIVDLGSGACHRFEAHELYGDPLNILVGLVNAAFDPKPGEVPKNAE